MEPEKRQFALDQPFQKFTKPLLRWCPSWRSKTFSIITDANGCRYAEICNDKTSGMIGPTLPLNRIVTSTDTYQNITFNVFEMSQLIVSVWETIVWSDRISRKPALVLYHDERRIYHSYEVNHHKFALPYQFCLKVGKNLQLDFHVLVELKCI